MRRQRMTTGEDAKQILAAAKYGVLCTAGADGMPYGVPVNYAYNLEKDIIWIHCATEGRKLDNIAVNPRVSLTAVAYEHIVGERFTTHYESAVAEGRAEIVSDAAEMTDALLEICRALAPEATERRDEVIAKYLPQVRIIKITVEKLSGKRNIEI